MTIRRYQQADRAQALALLGDARAIDSPSHRILIDPAGAGLALWVKPDAGEEGYLGPVCTAREDRRLFYRLVAAACQDAIEHGFKRGYFTISDRRLLTRLQRDFDIDPQPSGWEPNTDWPVQWDVHVDLEDALAQLQRVIVQAEPSSSSVETPQDEA